MNIRLVAVLTGAAVLISARAAAAQTTMAPTAAPVVGPTASPAATRVPSMMSTSEPVGAPTPGMPGMGKTSMPMPGGPVALDARHLSGTRIGIGYRLKGQALVKDACTAARFSRVLGNIFPPFFNIVQYRRPGTLGLLCIPRLTWVTVQPLSVTSSAPPRFVTVHTAKGSTRVPIVTGAAY